MRTYDAKRLIRYAACLAAGVSLSTAFCSETKVTVAENAGDITLDNGLVRFTVNRTGGNLPSIKILRNGDWVELADGREGLYLDVNGGPAVPPAGHEATKPPKGYMRPLGNSEVKITSRGPDKAEVILNSAPSPWFPIGIEMHYVLLRGESGFYSYAVYRHGPGMKAVGIGQTRVAIKGRKGTDVFTHHMIDETHKGPFPTAKWVQDLQDATGRLEDGTIYTKYDNSLFSYAMKSYGMAGHGLGMWMVLPSVEYMNGGPLKQELTVHMENVLLNMFEGGHFGAAGIDLADDEKWEKCFGPFMIYLNQGQNEESLWRDAQSKWQQEHAKWPYTWVAASGETYPLVRGNVTGQVRLTDSASARDAWVILSPVENADWAMSAKGYQFWTKTDSDGRFDLRQVRPGTYKLNVSGANQFVDLEQSPITVQAGKTTELGPINWTPIKHGRTLWQIGTADRSTAEFKRGDDFRHFGNFLRYPGDFPNDVNFVIGKSKESADWNFAHWTWYSRKPHWSILFDQQQKSHGTATLTIGLAATQPPPGNGTTHVVISVNGQEVGEIKRGRSGMAGYRSGGQDSRYVVDTFTFDAALLKSGRNEITLGHRDAAPFPEGGGIGKGFGQVMYDALRLEVNENQEFKK